MENGIDRIKIIIATHKKYRMPTDEMYIPLYVGAEGKKDSKGNDIDLGYAKDNTGENISDLNSSFCELTGLYWVWKNLDADYLGLVHYRRHFCMKKSRDLFGCVLTYEEIKPLLSKYKIFVPTKREYYIETLYSHYSHTHYSIHMDITREIINQKYPDYIDSYDRVLKRTYGYMFNMMIMQKELIDNYCSWLFDILFEVGRRINMPDLSKFQARYYGRISEIIFNVWIDHQLKIGKVLSSDIKEISYIYMERINWKKKLTSFMKSKLFHKRYEQSF